VPPGARERGLTLFRSPQRGKLAGDLIWSRSTVTAQYKSFDAQRAMPQKVRENDFTEISSPLGVPN
jgi:hypothetical protein